MPILSVDQGCDDQPMKTVVSVRCATCEGVRAGDTHCSVTPLTQDPIP